MKFKRYVFEKNHYFCIQKILTQNRSETEENYRSQDFFDRIKKPHKSQIKNYKLEFIKIKTLLFKRFSEENESQRLQEYFIYMCVCVLYIVHI